MYIKPIYIYIYIHYTLYSEDRVFVMRTKTYFFLKCIFLLLVPKALTHTRRVNACKSSSVLILYL